jgi:predicted enzyme related to lactoylglutathione lyase
VSDPVVHFEIIGKDASKLRTYYGTLFGWQFDTNSPVAKEVSDAGNYGFIDRDTTPDAVGIPGGVGGGPTYDSHAIFYVGVRNVEAALQKAESLGGRRVMGPAKNPGGELVIAQFTDPEGNLIGLAGPE